MAVLGGEFGIMVLVSAPADRLGDIARDQGALEQKTGLQCIMRLTQAPEVHRRASVVPCQVLVTALDQPGIVHAISNTLHQTGINIVSLETTAYHAPVTGSPLFRLEAVVDVPRGVAMNQVRDALGAVAQSLNLDVEVHTLVG
jgi:glycine cleavage system transcriptional repressor